MFSRFVGMSTLFGISIQLFFFFTSSSSNQHSFLPFHFSKFDENPFYFLLFGNFPSFFFFFSFYSFFFLHWILFKPPHWNKLIKNINRTNRTQGIVKIDWILRKNVAFSKPYKWQLNRKQKKKSGKKSLPFELFSKSLLNHLLLQRTNKVS